MNPPDKAPAADTVLIESTYGDRSHPPDDLLDELGSALHRLAARGGVAVFPVFARGPGTGHTARHTTSFKARGDVPSGLPVFLDSPMAVHPRISWSRHLGEHRLNAAEVRALTHSATMVSSTDESKALARATGPW